MMGFSGNGCILIQITVYYLAGHQSIEFLTLIFRPLSAKSWRRCGRSNIDNYHIIILGLTSNSFNTDFGGDLVIIL